MKTHTEFGFAGIFNRGMRRLLFMAAALVAVLHAEALAFKSLGDAPDGVPAEGPGFTNSLVRSGDVWADGRIAVTLRKTGADADEVSVASPEKPLSFVRIFWKHPMLAATRLLGDCWERSYGNLAWRPLGERNPIPWYFLAHGDDGVTHGYGVMVQPNALACWRATADGIELAVPLLD